MDWLFDLYRTDPTTQAIVVVALVCAAGMALGSFRIRKIGLGSAAVLFVAIAAGAWSTPIDPATLEFLRDFGLILFIYCIGLQLAPGFLASLRRVGLPLNLLAVAVVAIGTCVAVTLGWLTGMAPAARLGVLCGATTNTPSLAAAQQALSRLPGVSAEDAALPAVAYAVTYPVAIVGIIASMLLLQVWFRVDPRAAAATLAERDRLEGEPILRRTILIEDPLVSGRSIGELVGSVEGDLVLALLRRAADGVTGPAPDEARLAIGDRVLAVGTLTALDRLEARLGRSVEEDLLSMSGPVAVRRIVATRSEVLGRTLRELALDHVEGVAPARVRRAGIEFAATPSMRLQFGDEVQVIGEVQALARAAERLGDSVQALNQTHFVPIFGGICLGVAVGTLPFTLPFLGQPVELGLAGGPLLVALIVGRISRIGRVVLHIPPNVNAALREFGIALFFAAVGLLAGPTFFSALFSTSGLLWIACGLGTTMLPLLLVGTIALGPLGRNYTEVSGLLAGSMTNSPALAYANDAAGGESPAIAFAAVYPLTTVLRILIAQILVVALFRWGDGV